MPPNTPPSQNQQTGTYYKGRLGLPTNYDFNSNIRRIQPGPRFRNGMMRPKHFRGKIFFSLYVHDSEQMSGAEIS